MTRVAILLGLLTAAVLTGTTWAAELRPMDFVCPVDDYKFTLPVLAKADAAAGWDSDLCQHTVGLSPVTYSLVTCPRCNYTAMQASFVERVKPEQSEKILAALAGSKYRGVEDSFTEIPTWERAKLAGICGRIKGEEPSKQADYERMAIYSLRIDACRSVDRLFRIESPLTIQRVLAAAKLNMQDESKPSLKAEYLLYLAMICERAGFTAERDQWLAKAEQDKDLPQANRIDLKKFAERTVQEKEWQEKLVTTIDEALKQQGLPAPSKDSLRYLKADTLRRLGRLQEAAADFQIVRDSAPNTGTIRELSDYFLGLLKPAGATKEPAK